MLDKIYKKREDNLQIKENQEKALDLKKTNNKEEKGWVNSSY